MTPESGRPDAIENPMLLGQIEGFLAIARAGNVSRAAAELYLTQPALTARLQGLEEDLGATLFVRSTRGMKLTDAGRAYLPYAERTVGLLSEARQAVHDLRDGVSGSLLIGAAPAISTYVLPAVLKVFSAAHPEIRLGVRTGHSEEVLAMVLNEEVHVGIARPVRHSDIVTTHLYDDEVIFVVGAEHEFAGRRSIRMAELATERLILFDRTSSYHDLTSSLFRQAGVVPRSTMELDNAEAAKKMVLLGLGVALLPRSAIADELAAKTMRAVELKGAPRLVRRVVALRRRDVGVAGSAVTELLATIRDLYATAAPHGHRARRV